MPTFFERVLRDTRNFVEDFGHQAEIRVAQRSGASDQALLRMRLMNEWRINSRRARQGLGEFFEDLGFGRQQERRQTLGQRTAEGFMNLYEGMEELSEQSGRAFMRGARALGQKFREFWEWLGEVAQTCKDYVTEKGRQAINGVREVINNIAQVLNNISRGRGEEGRNR